ncbi:hypothetical protein CHARACLAT_030811 [Characodon lateralis]|uniref:Ubiquinol-cytochrome c chaperone domain-containing protein n=1 Tax=Characodon lateralis TaxID=208331 RepID=A0ABU7E949_9TELE|nr:hypothetical protein [Characodon lateralis]
MKSRKNLHHLHLQLLLQLITILQTDSLDFIVQVSFSLDHKEPGLVLQAEGPLVASMSPGCRPPCSAPCSAVYRVCLSVQIFTVILFVLQIDAILRKEAMKAMTETFYAAIFGYDEGILSDDCVLAAALWRNLFNRQCEDPQQLELMVEYVRKQVCLFLSVSF